MIYFLAGIPTCLSLTGINLTADAIGLGELEMLRWVLIGSASGLMGARNMPPEIRSIWKERA